MVSASQGVEQLRQLLQESQRAVVFTGAGISTESGIPDFRSPGGLWSENKPIEFDDFMSSEDMRVESWRRRFAMDAAFANAKPNRGHRAVAKLVADGKADAVITQNIDNLHQKSGVAEDKVIELHGNITYAKCLKCNQRYELGPIRTAFERDGTPPYCEACGGIVKTATISFGQPMPGREMRRAEAATRDCDLFLAIGSSLVVYPAAAFPALAKRIGARLVILNREATPMDEISDLALHAEIGPTLGAAVGVD